ncbi:MAG: hypothetical protein PHY09_18015 [Desulfuromonadaceae bacterium]|nr:hypothetical protein [Desulfuromonadaceae bacterium]MDD5107844.1 hypothetical protein [Desulfuromonadaceae bacterium]
MSGMDEMNHGLLSKWDFCWSINPPAMEQGPMPESAGHMAADNTNCQCRCEKLRHKSRPEMNRSDQADMHRRSKASYLIWPVSGSDDIQEYQEASGYDGQMMPG